VFVVACRRCRHFLGRRFDGHLDGRHFRRRNVTLNSLGFADVVLTGNLGGFIVTLLVSMTYKLFFFVDNSKYITAVFGVQ
jgi:hypothetical protein